MSRSRASRKRSKKKPRGILRRWKLKLALIANVALLIGGAAWYVVQPPGRQEEVRILLGNYLERNKRIRIWEVARDVYTLYYSDAFTATSCRGGDNPVYGGYPRGNGFDHRIRVLENDGFVVGYVNALRSPAWVGYRLFDVPGDVRVAERPDNFEVDHRTVARVESRDFTGTGYDRGHLAPNFGIARCHGRQAQQQTFLMSNIVPQRHAMNAGPWRELEMREALNYTGRFREIWVITGPIFYAEGASASLSAQRLPAGIADHPAMAAAVNVPVLGLFQLASASRFPPDRTARKASARGPGPRRFDSGVAIPDACYKIIVDEHEGGIRMQAFIVMQDADERARLATFLTSVDEIERLTALDFFPDLEEDAAARLESQTPARPW